MSLSSGGYVNDQGVANPTQTVTVVAGSTVQTQVNYDRAATLNLTMVGGAGGSIPNSMPYTIFNTGLLPNGLKRISGSGLTGPNRTISSLYPYLSGYQLWAGSCIDADPQGQKPSGGAYYPGATRDPALATTPGGATTGNINMPSLLVNVRKAGVPLAGAQVTVVHAPDTNGLHGRPDASAAGHDRRQRQHPRRAALRALDRPGDRPDGDGRRLAGRHPQPSVHAACQERERGGELTMRRHVMQTIKRRLGIESLRDEQGVTLTELVMVTAILAIVMTFVTSGFVSMQSAVTTDDIKLQNLDEARTLMDNMTKDIRTATLLPVPSATSPFTIADASRHAVLREPDDDGRAQPDRPVRRLTNPKRAPADREGDATDARTRIHRTGPPAERRSPVRRPVRRERDERGYPTPLFQYFDSERAP